jgi:drug/metabolite transporter (DMT)-like permease
MDPKLIGVAAALGSAAAWAVGSILFKNLGDHLSPVALTFAKGTAASVILGALLAFVGFEPIAAGPLVLLLLSGLLGIAVGDTLFFMALNRLDAHTVVLMFPLGQVLTVLMAVAFLDERPTLNQWIGIGLVVAGVTAVLWMQMTDEQRKISIPGLACGLGAVLAMSVSIIVAKDALETVGSLQATLVRMVAGTLAMLALMLVRRELSGSIKSLESPKVMAQFIGSVTVIAIGGFWWSMHAVKYIDVALANTLNSTEPLFVLPLAAYFLREKVTLKTVGSSLVAMTGIGLILGAL